MARVRQFATALGCAILVFAAPAVGDEVERTVTGMVAEADPRHCIVWTTRGDSLAIELTPQTKYWKDSVAETAAVVKPGARVTVVATESNAALTATEVRVTTPSVSQSEEVPHIGHKH